MRFVLCLCSALFLVSVLPGCGLFRKKKKPEAPKPTLIGIVEMVNPEQNYVLVRCENIPPLDVGTELTALDATGVESKLKVTPERKGRYLTADIVSGQPRVTNLVLIKAGAEIKPPPPSPPPPPTMPSQPTVAPLPMPMPFNLPVDNSPAPASGGVETLSPGSAPAITVPPLPSAGNELEPQVR
ncbi:MAG TPA: hypothetical protein VGE29_10400 [Prosthecobacter sp.]